MGKTPTPVENPIKRKLSLKGETHKFSQHHRKKFPLTLAGKIPKNHFQQITSIFVPLVLYGLCNFISVSTDCTHMPHCGLYFFVTLGIVPNIQYMLYDLVRLLYGVASILVPYTCCMDSDRL